jgi:hypothetical protein|tara:strand:- start:2121 stop:2783 length:663 start_codon:yes stop_codon:yes gene_type:complete
MAISTYAQLKTSIANWLNRSDLTSEISDDFIKLCEADFNAKLRIRQMEQQDDVTIDAEQVTVPTGFIAVRSFYIDSGVKYPLEYITPANMFEIKGGSRTGRPRAYTIESDNEVEKFRFAPSPDVSYTGKLSYYKAISELSDTNTSNYILSKHPAIYLYGSLYHAANFLGGVEPNQAQQWLAMYMSALERCENNDKQDTYGNAPVVQRTDVQTDLSFYRQR